MSTSELKLYTITFKSIFYGESKDYLHAKNKTEAKEKFIRKNGKCKILKIEIT